jgi:hypothetical protein
MIFLEHWSVEYPKRKTFIYEYERDVAQKKIYGKRMEGLDDGFGVERPCLELYQDKAVEEKADINKKYIVDYYYEYGNEALIYSI